MYRRAGFFLLIFLLGVLLIGCQSAERKPLESQDRDRDSISASERRVLADRLSRLATEVKGVQKATVVISEVTLADSTEVPAIGKPAGKQTQIHLMLILAE